MTVTKSGRSIIVNFAGYAESQNAIEKSFDETDLVEVERVYGDEYCIVLMRDAIGIHLWNVTRDQTYNGTDRFIITQINGSSIASNEALFDALTGLRG